MSAGDLRYRKNIHKEKNSVMSSFREVQTDCGNLNYGKNSRTPNCVCVPYLFRSKKLKTLSSAKIPIINTSRGPPLHF